MPVFRGTPGADTLTGSDGRDSIFGNGSTDVIRGRGGPDTLVGRGSVNGEGGNDRYFSIDFFRVFPEEIVQDVTVPNLSTGNDLLVIDEHDEQFGRAGRNSFSEIDLGPGRDKVIIGGAEGGQIYLGEGADRA